MKNWEKVKGVNGETLIIKRSFNGSDLYIKKLVKGWEASNTTFGLHDHPDYQEDYAEAFFGIKKIFKTAKAAADYLMKSCLFLEAA